MGERRKCPGCDGFGCLLDGSANRRLVRCRICNGLGDVPVPASSAYDQLPSDSEPPASADPSPPLEDGE